MEEVESLFVSVETYHLARCPWAASGEHIEEVKEFKRINCSQ